MKTLVYAQLNRVTCRDEPEPRLARGEVIISIDAAGGKATRSASAKVSLRP